MKEIVNSEFAPEAGKIVVVEFYAEWCGPCKTTKPIIEEFGNKHPEIDVYLCNIDENEELVDEYKIRSIPTILFFNDCKLKTHHVGSTNLQTLEQKLLETI